MAKDITPEGSNTLTLYIVKSDSDIKAISIESDTDLISFLEDDKSRNKTIQVVTKSQEEDIHNHLFVKDKDYFRKIYFDQILWIEAAGSYCYMHIKENNKKLCLSFTLSEIILQLPQSQFVQTHRSYIVNITHIDSFIGNTICIGIHKIPISKKIRSNIIKRLNVLGKTSL